MKKEGFLIGDHGTFNYNLIVKVENWIVLRLRQVFKM